MTLYDAAGLAVWQSHSNTEHGAEWIIGKAIWEFCSPEMVEPVKSAFAKAILFKELSEYWIDVGGDPVDGLYWVIVIPVENIEAVACCTMSFIAESGHTLLSEGERVVLRHLGVGDSVRTIAETMFLSVSTVQTHIARIRQKLGLPTQQQVVAYAARFV